MNYYTIKIKDENLTQEAALDILNAAKRYHIREFDFVEHTYLTYNSRGIANIRPACIKHNIHMGNIKALEDDDKEVEFSPFNMENFQKIITQHIQKAIDKIDFEAIIKKYI